MSQKVRISLLLMSFLFVMAFSSHVTAGDFFIDCGEALSQKGFLKLKEYYDANPDKPKPDMCFRLNNYEFLVTVTGTGRVAQGLYYYDAKENKMELYEGAYMADIEVKKEFLGKNKKRYVLISWSNLAHGNWDYGYDILNLISKAGKKPFVLYNLLSVNEDPEAGLCGEWSSKDKSGKAEKHQKIKEGITSRIKGYKILNEGTEKVKIVFTITEQDCKTLKRTTYEKVFSLVGDQFKAEK